MKKLFALFCTSLFTIGCINQPVKKVKSLNKHKAILAYQDTALLGEGAIWNQKSQELYWIDIEGKNLHVFNPKTKKNSTYKTPSRIGTVVPIDNSNTLIALEDGIYTLNRKNKEISLLVDMKNMLVGSRLNDGKCDALGRFWVGSMHLQQQKNAANLFCIDSSYSVKKKLDSITISNGVVWSKDHKTMYYIDTPTLEIKAFDYQLKTGEISNERIVISIDKSLGYPDGMTIDEEDMLWVGMWNGNAVIRFDPKTGKVDRKVEVPAHNITSCAFGGKDLDTLYITSARVDMTEDELKQYPLSGSIFKYVPGIRGTNSYFFKKQHLIP